MRFRLGIADGLFAGAGKIYPKKEMTQPELLEKLSAEIADLDNRLNKLKANTDSDLFAVSQSSRLLYTVVFYTEQRDCLQKLKERIEKGENLSLCMKVICDLTYSDRVFSCSFYEKAELETRMAAKLDLLKTLWSWKVQSAGA